MPEEPQTAPSRWLRRLQAVGFGFLCLLVLEGALRTAGYGGDQTGDDPFVGFSAVEPLFALDPVNGRYDLRPERCLYFIRNGFPRYKRPGTLRVFVFGGSTVQGRPYSIETAFPQWLKVNLELAYPGRNVEMVNCGGISYASYRLVPIIRECLGYEPDLFIVCTGQNEFLEARAYRSIKPLARSLGEPVRAIRTLATYQAMDRVYQTVSGASGAQGADKKPTLPMEVDAFLDYRRGLTAYHRDPEWKEGVITHFKENIRRIHSISREAGVPLMLFNPPFNLKDCPPFKTEPGPGLSAEKRAEIEGVMRTYSEMNQVHPVRAAQFLVRRADQLDESDASAHYLIGHCYLRLGDSEKALASFVRALEEDICSLRILPEMREFVESYAAKKQLPYLDLQEVLLRHSGSPILGSEMLVDHIHPSIRGHQIIGEAAATLVAATSLSELPRPVPDEKRKAAYDAQLESLDDLYYTHGQTRLENLRVWTKGMTQGPPIEMHVPIDSGSSL